MGRKRRDPALQEKANDIYSQLDPHGERAKSLAQEKGASIFLITVVIDEHAFASQGEISMTRSAARLETSIHAQPLLRWRAIHRGVRAELQSWWLRLPSPRTMKSETYSRISCQTLAITSPPSLTYNPSVESGFSRHCRQSPTRHSGRRILRSSTRGCVLRRQGVQPPRKRVSHTISCTNLQEARSRKEKTVRRVVESD